MEGTQTRNILDYVFVQSERPPLLDAAGVLPKEDPSILDREWPSLSLGREPLVLSGEATSDFDSVLNYVFPPSPPSEIDQLRRQVKTLQEANDYLTDWCLQGVGDLLSILNQNRAEVILASAGPALVPDFDKREGPFVPVSLSSEEELAVIGRAVVQGKEEAEASIRDIINDKFELAETPPPSFIFLNDDDSALVSALASDFQWVSEAGAPSIRYGKMMDLGENLIRPSCLEHAQALQSLLDSMNKIFGDAGLKAPVALDEVGPVSYFDEREAGGHSLSVAVFSEKCPGLSSIIGEKI